MVRSSLQGQEVAITGRLASMTRKEAIVRLRQAGGRYVEEPGETTHFLVLGQEGWPRRSRGRATNKLVTARKMERAGGRIRIVPEPQFVAWLGRAEGIPERAYTIAQLGRILGVSLTEIRSWVRSGLIEPVKVVRRLAWFDFRQVVQARALYRLQSSGINLGEVKKSLAHLAQWLPGGTKLLHRLESLSLGRRVQVRLENGRLADPSGQLCFDFDARDSTDAEPIHTRALRQDSATGRGYDAWFLLGVAAEERGEWKRAIQAYERSLQRSGPAAETYFNLANVHYAQQQCGEAVQRYLEAVKLDNEFVEAWNNLGNALADLGQCKEATQAYEAALSIEPRYADAHCNLAEVLLQLGRPGDARKHWLAYLREDPDSSWAKEVRKRLARLPELD